MPDTDSDPVVPKFYVQYKEVRSGQLYNTFYTRIQIEIGTPATSEPVSVRMLDLFVQAIS